MTERPEALAAYDLDFVRRLARERAGLVLDADKAYLIEARLGPLAARQGFPSAAALIAQAREHPHGALADAAVEALLTGETMFFRDGAPFEALREAVLPALLAARDAGRPLALWSAACSSGQEAYSLAILIKEHFPALASGGVSILATDLSREQLARAAAGRYTDLEVGRGLPPALRARYLRRVDEGWEIDPALKRLIEFRPLNLIDPWPPLPVFDVVLLRHVLIYFDLPTRREVLARVRRQLRPDGYLFLGGAETTQHLDDGFERAPDPRDGYLRPRPVPRPGAS